MKKIVNVCLTLILVCLYAQLAWANPCPVTVNADPGNTTSLRGAAELLENSSGECKLTSSFPDNDYFDQYVYFETATYGGRVDTIELATPIYFDAARLDSSRDHDSAAVIGNPTSYGLADTTDDVSYTASDYSDLDTVLVVIDGSAITGQSPLQCATGSKNVYMRGAILLTDTLKQVDFEADPTTACIKSGGDFHICTKTAYHEGFDVRDDTSGWCDDFDTGDGLPDFPWGDFPHMIAQKTLYADTDGDGYGDATSTIKVDIVMKHEDTDGDGDLEWHFTYDIPDGYVTDNTDCDDTDPAINPGEAEICDDGIDNNCDGAEDEGCSETYYPDTDSDGYGDERDSGTDYTSDPGTGWSTENTDCDDAVATVNPAATEVCDDVDNNCDGQIDEGFDTDGDGVTTCEGDCDDTSAATYPSAPETCEDGIDQDCNGYDATCAEDDADGDGYTETTNDCDDNNAAINPAAEEVCDGIDNNCDGIADGGLDCSDDDADGDGYTVDGGDCDDTSATTYPSAPETCGDNIDQDCDGADLTCVEDCSDSVDNNNDGLIDCDDPECENSPLCDVIILPASETECSDNVDNDGDGMTDCADPDCYGVVIDETTGAACGFSGTIGPGSVGVVSGGADLNMFSGGCSLGAGAGQGGSIFSLISSLCLFGVARLFKK